jgi:hypothetical protein
VFEVRACRPFQFELVAELVRRSRLHAGENPMAARRLGKWRFEPFQAHSTSQDQQGNQMTDDAKDRASLGLIGLILITCGLIVFLLSLSA